MAETEVGRVASPVLRVVRGAPTPMELAALVAVVGAVSAAAAVAVAADAAGTDPGRSAWGDPARALRRPVRPGPDGWRGSVRPT